MFLSLISRLIYLQIFSFTKYRNIAHKNKVMLLPMIPERGKIWDINGTLLVSNNKNYRLLLNKGKYLSNKKILREIQDFLDLDDEFFVESLIKIKNARNKSYVILINNLNWGQISKIETNIDRFDGVIIDLNHPRCYYYSTDICHVIGYVRHTATKEFDLANKNHQSKDEMFDMPSFIEISQLSQLINQNSQTILTQKEILNNIGSLNLEMGIYGAEKQYNKILFGKVGYIEIEADATGKHVKELSFSNSIQGKDMHMFLDINLQQIINKQLPDKSCCIVNKLENNAILGMVSKPHFDSKILSNNITHHAWREIQKSNSLINRCIQGQYNPGSVFKLVTILSALENGIDPNFSCICTSQPFLDKHFHCWNKFGHGRVKSMSEALSKSCNHYMFKLAKHLSIEKILSTARKFGFGSLTEIDLPHEKSGSIKFHNNKLTTLLMLSIGQGFITTTPIQIAKMISMIFNNGEYHKFKCANNNLNLLKVNKIYTPENNVINFNKHLHINEIINENIIDIKKWPKTFLEEHLDVLREGMYKSINSTSGNSYKNRLKSGLILFGKTSTIQTVSRSQYSDKNKNHGMFAGYISHEGVNYGITVFIENGETGQKALKVAGKILTEYLLNKKHDTPQSK